MTVASCEGVCTPGLMRLVAVKWMQIKKQNKFVGYYGGTAVCCGIVAWLRRRTGEAIRLHLKCVMMFGYKQ